MGVDRMNDWLKRKVLIDIMKNVEVFSQHVNTTITLDSGDVVEVSFEPTETESWYSAIVSQDVAEALSGVPGCGYLAIPVESVEHVVPEIPVVRHESVSEGDETEQVTNLSTEQTPQESEEGASEEPAKETSETGDTAHEVEVKPRGRGGRPKKNPAPEA
jgi:hypothetical protein